MQFLPRFSLRTGLIALTVGALLAVSLRAAAIGEPWAIGAGIGVLSLPVLLCFHALLYALARMLARSPVRRTQETEQSSAESPA
ncbi:hypothetical protein [Botrimarina hoheduenensis]|uniref:Uncharacterized protein n=1 Tax=Botrimarina hoheduenensis TaxID=2528000 RepID=A0A5C5WFH4_9BACT|nr:hypothetical protein [Botrimarina hoheduenensis]TWT48861.1 hypothetical protein Pla111_06370 [Botrimarina hoheduenensis]